MMYGYNFAEGYLHAGLQVIAVAKSSDVVLMVLDASKVTIVFVRTVSLFTICAYN